MARVPHTCPNIDRVIRAIRLIEKIAADMCLHFPKYSLDDMYTSFDEIRYEVSGLECVMEELRDANSQLRENAEYAKQKLDELELESEKDT